jgi:hypothetical protein
MPGEDHDGRIDDIRGLGRAARLFTHARKLLVKSNDLNVIGSQEPCQDRLNTTVATALPRTPEGTRKEQPRVAA